MRTRWWMAAFLVVLLVVLWFQSNAASGPTVTMRDGTSVRFAGLTREPPHRYIDRGLIGLFRYTFFKGPPNTRSSTDDWIEWDSVVEQFAHKPVAWFVRRNPRRVSAQTLLKISSCTLFDEHGCEVAARGGDDTLELGGWSRRSFMFAQLYGMPPGAHRLGVRFWDAREDATPGPAAEFDVLEEVPPAVPVWTPGTLPQTVRRGDFSCRLLSFESRWKPMPYGTRAPGYQRIHTRLALLRGAKPIDDWEVCGVRVRTAAGEVWEGESPSAERKGDEHHVEFFAPLWDHELAYDLEFDLLKTRAGKFTPTQRHSLELLVDDRSLAHYIGSRPETPLQWGADTVYVGTPLQDYQGYWGTEQSVLTFPVWVTNAKGSRRIPLVVEGVDERGRSVRFPKPYWQAFRSLGQPINDYTSLALIPPQKAKKVQLTLAIAGPETIRFRVKPVIRPRLR